MYTVTHVSIKVTEGGHNLVKVEEFLDMAYDIRMKLLSTHSLTFLDETGNIVPLIEGVKYTANLLRMKSQGVK